MRADLLGCSVDILTMTETVERVQGAMRDRRRLHHVALNVAKFVNMRSDNILRSDVLGSDLIGIDGMGIVLALRMLGVPVQERVTGIDLCWQVLSVCARDGFRPFLLGATPDVLHRAAGVIEKQFPSLQIAGSRDGYFRTDQEEEVVQQIIDSKADCLFIAMPTPRKERFLSAHKDRLSVPFIMGVGGSLDVIAGHVRRAPPLMQSMGLEWLYRVYQEPRRMWWRYTKTNVMFAAILVRAFLSQQSIGPGRLSRSG
ncbi:WecB/TagA/CpsF family glycosyltransferase [Bradyrhizobium sp. WSM471]|jgi:N-acetylglucosaminyldiphosphoundecaprenol N-acetyl-beta-D-mannosaminyltransferase|uniref:WecB/TagA/CpsF family glycosyltransferase n=1 Tax=Bradyrhizobium sp. WSM471 TaxID=319017 RepID=UPI00024D23FD|nr:MULTISPECIES: WecB/TagA/CpsF family glycosyltransferase [Bradyrhizobium]EHR01477.1 exopolysaccharide biosynthesis protein, WecB/TagA/CpsF family [Bradyrhizobium sp. WSM471]UFW43532.1 WecB/TagA/CpsF family glycosyltransferase [Bradyrhizobium canariense]